jgi:hypothetical protein
MEMQVVEHEAMEVVHVVHEAMEEVQVVEQVVDETMEVQATPTKCQACCPQKAYSNFFDGM